MTIYTTPSIARPDPVRWLWYTFGGRLGPNYRGWVLHDTTTRTRWLRQVVRGSVQVVPAALLIWAVMPSSWFTGMSIVLGLLLVLWYSVAYLNQTAERRLVKHGYAPGTLEMALRERYLRRATDPGRRERFACIRIQLSSVPRHAHEFRETPPKLTKPLYGS